MKSIYDEVLESEQKFRIRDKDGNILFDELTIEQITPVVQEGTTLNKATLHTVAKNALIYEVPTYSTTETPVLKESLIPALQSNSQNGYELTGYDDAYQMFDGDDSEYIIIIGGDGREITFETPVFMKLKNVMFKYSSNNASRNNTLVYRITGILPDREEIDIVPEARIETTGVNLEILEIPIIDSWYFSQFKLYLRSSNADSSTEYACRMYEIVFNGEEISADNITTLHLEGNDMLANNQIVRIKTTNDTVLTNNTMIQYGDDTAKSVIPLLKNNKYIDLLYNGIEFIERLV